MDDNLNLFSLVDEEEKSAPNKKRGSKLDVVEMEYKQAHAVTWQELFEGFDTIHAITFSSGLNFVYQLLDMFDRAEIIFGCEHILSSSMNQIIAYQDKLIERMREQSSEKMNDCLPVWIREKFGFMYPAVRFPTKNCICWRRQMAESALS
jgi:hypothetical protein